MHSAAERRECGGSSGPNRLAFPMTPTPTAADAMSGKTKRPEPAKDIPVQFGAFDTSGLSVEVKTGENNFDFDLAKLLKGASSEPVKVVK